MKIDLKRMNHASYIIEFLVGMHIRPVYNHSRIIASVVAIQTQTVRTFYHLVASSNISSRCCHWPHVDSYPPDQSVHHGPWSTDSWCQTIHLRFGLFHFNVMSAKACWC